MPPVPVLVIRAAGINCDEETMHCWRRAGASPRLEHVNMVADKPAMLDEFALVTIPGGFSYGDDIAAGSILAQRFLFELADPLRRFVERGGGVLGICNGFQVLVKAGLLPGEPFGREDATVTYNESARFEARWVRLQVVLTRCPFLTRAVSSVGDSIPASPGEPRASLIEMPIEHAEGRVVTSSDSVTRRLESEGRIALRYVDANGRHDRYPANPNGSTAGIAGLCDATGRVFGLMPHPDRHFDHAQHPQWTRRKPEGPADGLSVFLSAVEHWRA